MVWDQPMRSHLGKIVPRMDQSCSHYYKKAKGPGAYGMRAGGYDATAIR